MSVITRFAPSPTGFLHIGGARTALFNFLFARHHGGKYLLRIEDTDHARSTADAVTAIHEGLKWLGLEGDGDAVSQSARAPRHVEVANSLLEQGHAYRCYLTADELTAMRDEARANNTKIISPWRDASPASAPDRPFTIRLKMPQTGNTTIADGVQGDVTVSNKTLDDLVMLRGDGSPTYMLAVVVDDNDMGITHVIRGDDHLNNAFRQIKIIEALGWKFPNYAHIPLIHGADGAKLSKRHGALSATAYRDMGYLPEAMCNYLLRLGWAHGDDEIIDRDQAIKWFDVGGIGKSPARFDTAKLKSLNANYIRAMPPMDLAKAMLGNHDESEHILSRLTTLAPTFAERAELLDDLPRMAAFAARDDVPDIDDDAKPLLDAVARTRLLKLSHDMRMEMDSVKAMLGKHDASEHILSRLTTPTSTFAELAKLLDDLPQMAAFAAHEDVPNIDDDAKRLLDAVARTRLLKLSHYMRMKMDWVKGTLGNHDASEHILSRQTTLTLIFAELVKSLDDLPRMVAFAARDDVPDIDDDAKPLLDAVARTRLLKLSHDMRMEMDSVKAMLGKHDASEHILSRLTTPTSTFAELAKLLDDLPRMAAFAAHEDVPNIDDDAKRLLDAVTRTRLLKLSHYMRMKMDWVKGMLGNHDASEHILSRQTTLTLIFAELVKSLDDLPRMVAFAARDDVPDIDDDAKPLLDAVARTRLLELSHYMRMKMDWVKGMLGNHDASEHILSRQTTLTLIFPELAKLLDDLPRMAAFAAHDDVPTNIRAEGFKTWLGAWLEAEGLKMRDIAPPLRVAITGMKQTPDIMLISAALGMQLLRKRIESNCK